MIALLAAQVIVDAIEEQQRAALREMFADPPENWHGCERWPAAPHPGD